MGAIGTLSPLPIHATISNHISERNSFQRTFGRYSSYSGATLERPGLERVRDLAAEGQIQVVLAYAPDRLSRKR